MREWRARNVEKCREYYANYRAQHREKLRANGRRRWAERSDSYRLWKKAKERAEKDGIPFDIEVSDIEVPDRCPILGVPFERGVGTHVDMSPTLDRIVPELGYVKGNVAVISYRANRLKNDGSAAEHARIADWIQSVTMKKCGVSP